MPRAPRSETSQLMLEARAMEMLATEAEIDPGRLDDYWSLSSDLIALVADIEDLQGEAPNASEDDARIIALRHRLREVASRLAGMVVE